MGYVCMRKCKGGGFFDDKILKRKEYEVFVDVGAYTGDTILQFLEFCRGQYNKIYAFEPDRGNYSSLLKFIKYGKINNIETFNIGGWDCREEKEFFTLSDNDGMNYDSSNFYKNISRAIPNNEIVRCRENKICEASYIVKVDAIDNVIEDEEITIMKINALAADMPALKGAKNRILQSKPAIIMEYGVRPSYMTEEIVWLDELKVGYRFYMRQKNIFGDCKTILYAICV